MRPLTEEETKTVFLKLSEYIGKNIERMINRNDERHCFRLIKVIDFFFRISRNFEKAANLLILRMYCTRLYFSGALLLH